MRVPRAEHRVLRVLAGMGGWVSTPEVLSQDEGIKVTSAPILLRRLVSREMVETRGERFERQWRATGMGKRVSELLDRIEKEVGC